MRCGYCGKNEATKTYERIKDARRSVEYYCMDCYHKLFLDTDKAEGETSLSACPYCGMTIEEFRAGKIVGCAYCYRTMRAGILPTIVKMQGELSHTGKTPPLGDGDMAEEPQGIFHAEATERARYQRQCNDLEIIIAKLKAENNYEDAKGYADKLSSMRSNTAIEEEFVWRTRRSLLKQS